MARGTAEHRPRCAMGRDRLSIVVEEAPMIRLSVGIEDTEDLLEDFRQALEASKV